MIRRVLALGYNGLLQLLRSRLYLNLLVAGGVLVVAALLFDRLSAGEGGRVPLLNIGLSFIALVTAILAGSIGVVLVTREIETKQIHLLIARPIARFELVVGRFTTLAGLVIISNGALAILLALMLWATGADDAWRAVVAAMFCCFEGFIVAAIAVLFGVGSSSTMSALFTSTIFVVGRLALPLRELIEADKFQGPLEPVVELVYLVIPQLFRFDVTRWAQTGVAPEMGDVLYNVVYGILYTVALLAFASYRLERRDLL